MNFPNFGRQSSLIKIAIPMLMGAEIASAIKEESRVPTTTANAPKSSLTGSQLLENKNFTPKAFIEGADCKSRKKAIAHNTKTMEQAIIFKAHKKSLSAK
jgi:hypothetical protein